VQKKKFYTFTPRYSYFVSLCVYDHTKSYMYIYYYTEILSHSLSFSLFIVIY